MHDNRHARSPVMITYHTVWDVHGAHLYSRLRADLQRRLTVDLHSLPQPPISPENGRGDPVPPRTSISMQSPPSRGVLHGSDRSGCMACRQNKRIGQHRSQKDEGARMGMQDQRDPRPVAGTRPGCSVQDKSAARPCLTGCVNETTSGHRGWAVGSPGPNRSGRFGL